MKNKNEKLLKLFTAVCKKHPELRFWQTLSVWIKGRVFVETKENDAVDTFYWKNKNK